jgi:hypothetical protein
MGYQRIIVGSSPAARLEPLFDLSAQAAPDQKVTAANDRIRMGFIGVGEMGSAGLD